MSDGVSVYDKVNQNGTKIVNQRINLLRDNFQPHENQFELQNEEELLNGNEKMKILTIGNTEGSNSTKLS